MVMEVGVGMGIASCIGIVWVSVVSRAVCASSTAVGVVAADDDRNRSAATAM